MRFIEIYETYRRSEVGTLLFLLAVLKVIVDLLTMLIGAEGARLLREDGAGETPQALKRRGGSPNRPRKAKLLERKSTGKFNTAFLFIMTGKSSIIFSSYIK
jgi:hypothetical protein